MLLGNKLTAATVFTCMALINMLIGPLNAFPWVLNGVTEAWVSITRIQRYLNVSYGLRLSTYCNHISYDENHVEMNLATVWRFAV